MTTTPAPEAPPGRPTHPATPSQLGWLRDEVADWQREGLLTPAQGEAVLSRYYAARRVGIASLLLALGAVFVGFGLIWLVAANLDRLPPLGRFSAVAAIWVTVTVGAELLAVRREHGGPVPSPVVHAGRLLAVLLFGAVVFQAAQSLQVPAYEPRLVGVWALGALLHGYLVRAAAPVVVGVTAGFGWVVGTAVWDDPSMLGAVLAVSAAGVGALGAASLHDRLAPRRAGTPDLAWPWRAAGVIALLGALFTAALPFGDVDDLSWTPQLVAVLVVASVLAAAGAMPLLGSRRTPDSWLAWEPLGGLAVTGLAVLLVLWDAGSDASDVSPVDWAHAAVAVTGYLAVAAGVAALGVLRDRSHLTAIAVVALVLFTTFQSFAVFAQIIDGAWLFLAMGVVLAATGWVADRGRRRLARSLNEASAASRPTATGSANEGEQR